MDQESCRLDALHSLCVLDTPAEPAFDRLTRLAARLLDAPIAAIGFVDESRVWRKAWVGAIDREEDRAGAWCAHAIYGVGPLIVEDAARDPRFAGSAWAAASGVRAYAGVPLRSGCGQAVGVLCVADTVPRCLTRGRIEALVDLAPAVMEALERGRARRDLACAERALRQSEARFTRAIDGATDGLWDWEVGADAVWYAPRFKALLGYEAHEMPDTIGAFNQHLHPDDVEPTWDAVDAHLAGGPPYDVQYRLRCKDGSYRWFRARGVAQQDADGQLTRMAGSISDIQHTKQQEADLLESRARYREIYNTTPVMLQSIDAGGKVISVSNHWCERMGYTRDEVIGRHCTQFLTEASRREALAHGLPRFFERGQTRDRPYQLVTKPGQVIDVLLSATAEHDADGRFLRGLAVLVDVTERNRAERALAQALDAAQEASRSKSRFLANMSHEIRTPMTAILGYADLLLDPSQPDTDRRDCVRTIHRNCRHLLELINDILDVSKIEAGRMDVERIETDITRVVADVVSLMRGRALEKGLKLSVEYLSAIPAQVRTDPTRLRQILLNLVGNAVKFTEQGGVRLVVRLDRGDAQADPPRLRFEVIDTGIGIATDQLGRLFEAFTQADASFTRRFGGTGLGLAISLRLARMLGGEIDAVSQLGAGSSFVVTLPTGGLDGVAMIHHPEEAGQRDPGGALCGREGPTHAPADDRPQPLAGRRILLAEDGPDNQRLIGFVLRKAGAEVEVVDNGQLAVDAALRSQADGRAFDAVLMDIQMPVLDGYAATNALRAEGWTGPIIALTAHAMASDRDRCLDAGCDDYLTKPIDRALLVDTLARTREVAA